MCLTRFGFVAFALWALTVCQNMGKYAVSLFAPLSLFSAHDDAPSDGKG
jgi:hypothetical protein